MKWATPYQSAQACTGRARPGARALLAWGLETYPSSYSLGIYNCRTVVGGSTTSTHGEGRAVDLGLPVGADGRGTALGHAIVAQLGAHGARLGVQAIVYDRQVWSAKSPAGRAYGGKHPHYDHLHIELTRQAGDRLTLATFRAVLGGAAVSEEDDMILRESDRGGYVIAWQHRIHEYLGVDVAVDGDFGPATAAATRRAQAMMGLPETGEVTAVEWALLVDTHAGNNVKDAIKRHVKAAAHGAGDHDHDKRYAAKEHPHRAAVTLQ